MSKAVNRSERMGSRSGVLGFIDRLRYNELARQGLGLVLVLICAWYAAPGEGRFAVGMILAVLGQLWRIYAAGVIYKNRKLATTGAYSLVRHPLYLGNLMILAGFVLAAGHWIVAAVAVAFVLFYYPAAVRYEDSKLERIFGDEWRSWGARTPAVIPKSLRWVGNADSEWNARQSLIRNGELPITVYLIAAAAFMYLRSAA